MKPALVVLVVACLGLTASLVVIRQKAHSRVQTAEAQGARTAAELEETKSKFSELEKLYSVQQGTLNMRSEELLVASNSLEKVTGELAKVSEDLKAMQTEMLKRQERIAALESERDDLSKKMEGLTTSIDQLETQITDTKKKLDSAEGDKTFLLAELKRLQTEKDTLVRQFNDLATLRTQVAKLREEAAIKQRLEWKRMGVYAMQEKKGSERLVAKSFALARPDSRLNADIYEEHRPIFRSPPSTNDASGAASPVEPPIKSP